MDIGNRIKKIRKELDLTQAEFAARIGSVQNTVTGYENGRRNPSAPVISLICREFDIREEWLRTGEGKMFKPNASDVLDQLAYKYKLFNFDYVMIEKFLAMPPDLRRAIYDHFHDVDTTLAEMDPYAPAYTENKPPQPVDRISETIKDQQKENATLGMSAEQAEAEYIKRISENAQKGESTASNTTDATDGKRKISNQ